MADNDDRPQECTAPEGITGPHRAHSWWITGTGFGTCPGITGELAGPDREQVDPDDGYLYEVGSTFRRSERKFAGDVERYLSNFDDTGRANLDMTAPLELPGGAS